MSSDKRGQRPMAVILYTAPPKATAHSRPNTVQPKAPPTTPMQMGVYEAAIIT